MPIRLRIVKYNLQEGNVNVKLISLYFFEIRAVFLITIFIRKRVIS